jgi:methylphosphotriester-DNA--protein-cysteine methyltransferase
MGSAPASDREALGLTRDEMWTAFSRRDARYDGRFIAGVRSTGIFCRPVCP